jgi:endoglucanase
MNEPRLVDTGYEWNFSETSAECRDAAECINKLNQLFVDTVRATGGNNATRYLLVPGYCASPYGATNQYFRLPEDTADNRIIIEVHAYTPYNFALNQGDGSYADFDLEETKKIQEIAQFMNDLYKQYTSQGIPVVIDEYGAMEKKGNLQDRVNWAAYYVCAASARGMTCCWWDNNAFTGNGERFGIINRKTAEWKYPEIVEAIMANCMFNR